MPQTRDLSSTNSFAWGTVNQNDFSPVRGWTLTSKAVNRTVSPYRRKSKNANFPPWDFPPRDFFKRFLMSVQSSIGTCTLHALEWMLRDQKNSRKGRRRSIEIRDELNSRFRQKLRTKESYHGTRPKKISLLGNEMLNVLHLANVPATAVKVFRGSQVLKAMLAYQALQLLFEGIFYCHPDSHLYRRKLQTNTDSDKTDESHVINIVKVKLQPNRDSLVGYIGTIDFMDSNYSRRVIGTLDRDGCVTSRHASPHFHLRDHPSNVLYCVNNAVMSQQ